MMKRYKQDIEKMLEETFDLDETAHSTITFNKQPLKKIQKPPFNQNQAKQILTINKDILNNDKMDEFDFYVDLQIKSNLTDLSRSRSYTQLTETSVLPNIEIKQNTIQQLSQQKISKQKLTKCASKHKLEKVHVTPSQSFALLYGKGTK
ncbi:Hypothetical_protein [Hexamita inflata]|uniref:Hypothetical_protein n=1 Tax=Hexamita inflata TaxID=28002 RepID=A0AA86P0A4_9EUKA|nr:Hypothetical protein HINF_LOCUS16313 [Hexamita inflata]